MVGRRRIHRFLIIVIFGSAFEIWKWFCRCRGGRNSVCLIISSYRILRVVCCLGTRNLGILISISAFPFRFWFTRPFLLLFRRSDLVTPFRSCVGTRDSPGSSLELQSMVLDLSFNLLHIVLDLVSVILTCFVGEVVS